MIGIIDYSVGNPKSIQKMLSYLHFKSSIVSEPNELRAVEKIILPGVGAFDYGMKQLKTLGFRDVLDELVLNEKKPILGICLGAQLMTKGSSEGSEEGLGYFETQTKRFDFSDLQEKLTIPHMGWNRVKVTRGSDKFSFLDNFRFYFVHSFHFDEEIDQDLLTTTNYGYAFPSSLLRENILAVQFHPEKSHRFGMTFLQHFVEAF